MNKKPFIVIDWETFYDEKSGCSVKALGAHNYVRHPDFSLIIVSLVSEDYSYSGPSDGADWSRLDGADVWAHNSNFDQEVTEWAQHKGWIPKFTPASWQCSADLAAYLSNGGARALDKAVKFLYGTDLSKGMRTWMNGKSLTDLKESGKYQDYVDYCLSDSKWAYRIVKDYTDQMPEFEKQIAKVTRRQGRDGVRIDTELLDIYLNGGDVTAEPWCLLKNFQKHYDKETGELDTVHESYFVEEDGDRYFKGINKLMFDAEQSIPWVAEGEKPTSPKAFALECRKSGIKPPSTTRKDSEEFEEWLEEYGESLPWVAHMRDWRRMAKLKGALETIKARSDGDTFYFSLKYFGAKTGRWSGDGGFNMQNMSRGALFGIDIRKLFIPRKGKKFVTSDLSQIEPRCLRWLVRDFKMLNLTATGMSVYEAHARANHGYSDEAPLKEKDAQLYATSKAETLGLGYQMGPKKYIKTAKMMAGLDINLKQAKRAVYDYRQREKKVTGFWEQLNADILNAAKVGEDYVVELPSGREMVYKSPKFVQELREFDEDTEHPDGTVTTKKVQRLVTSVKATIAGMTTAYYGGVLTENTVQATARDVFAHNLLLVDALDKVIFSVHDEVVVEVDEEIAEDRANQITELMRTVPAWLKGCPLDVETHVVSRYCK